MTIESIVQSNYYGTLVTLVEIDASDIGGGVLRYTPGPFNGVVLNFNGEPWVPLPVEISGLSWSAEGGIPKPRLKVSNIGGQFVTALLNTSEMAGARVTITRTFEQFLDDGTNPDPQQKFPDDEFFIDRLVRWDNEVVEWQLSALMDQRGVKLPRRQILRDFCAARYRRYVDGEFDYAAATCPYTGTSYYDENNIATTAESDRCSKLLSGCRKRFGEHAELPFDGFPGAARVRENV